MPIYSDQQLNELVRKRGEGHYSLDELKKNIADFEKRFSGEINFNKYVKDGFLDTPAMFRDNPKLKALYHTDEDVKRGIESLGSVWRNSMPGIKQRLDISMRTGGDLDEQLKLIKRLTPEELRSFPLTSEQRQGLKLRKLKGSLKDVSIKGTPAKEQIRDSFITPSAVQ